MKVMTPYVHMHSALRPRRSRSRPHASLTHRSLRRDFVTQRMPKVFKTDSSATFFPPDKKLEMEQFSKDWIGAPLRQN